MRIRTLLAVSILVFVIAACSNDAEPANEAPPADGATGSTEPSETPEPSATDEPTETESPSATRSSSRSTELETEDSDLGTIIADSDGRTLYVFLADTGGESTCYDDCAATWPPLEVRGELEAGGDVDDSLLGTTERTDGALQVTYGGQPLYYFANDAQPGDTNGQGIGDVWYVVSPEGEPIQR